MWTHHITTKPGTTKHVNDVWGMMSHTSCTCFVILNLWYPTHYARFILFSYDIPYIMYVLFCSIMISHALGTFCCAQIMISHNYAHVLMSSVYDISYIMQMFCCAQFMISHTLCTYFVELSLWYLIHYANVLLRSVYDISYINSLRPSDALMRQ